ncbi:MAG: dTDP-glucose 4,6-dehydratase [Rickettsiales bacterium]|nr:dTDP-glucose 4,6-dehydratase [Rickettsiales bacterium]
MEDFKKILVTGGAGFIGGALIRNLLNNTNSYIFNLDKFGYASDLTGIKKMRDSSKRHKAIKLDLIDINAVKDFINFAKPDLIVHLAAESHVDRSINDPSYFINSNIIGTFNLIESARIYWESLNSAKKEFFRFHHVSTDEVFGTLDKDQYFDESSGYSPRSPYSASKASSDHIVKSWYHTYGFPVVITNCSNNYGPYQFPEKLIPLTILKAIKGENIPIYGNGSNQRDWLYVDDHVNAIINAFNNSKIGKTYCIGGNQVKTNLEVVKKICSILNKFSPKSSLYENQICFVKDRPGHDMRYAIDSSKIKKELNWSPTFTFDEGLNQTVSWYLENLMWCEKMMKNSGYLGDRLGIK